jgi:hypothetical protein
VNAAPLGSRDSNSEQKLVERILASRHFIKAPLLSAFLAYVCRRALEDGAVRIGEREIGVHVFDRKQDYESKEDNIVRNYARQLRKRLDEYYATDGLGESLRIEIPKGGYVPLFRLNCHPMIHPELAPDGERSQPERITSLKVAVGGNFRFAAAGVTVCSLLAGLMALFVHQHPKSPPRSGIEMHQLWTQLFATNRNTLIVPADTAYVMLQELKGKSFSLAEYASLSPVDEHNPSLASDLKNRRYTSLVDVEAVSQLQRLPEAIPDRCVIRAARSLTIEDLKNANIILLGSIYSIPWVEVFQKNLNFKFVYRPAENRSWIENRTPAPGESSTYTNIWNGLSEKAYAVVAYLPNLNNTGHVLLVEGLDGAGTQAAMNMLLGDGGLSEVLKKARNPDGTIGSFEVLLESTSLNSQPTGIRFVAARKPS